MFLVSFYNYFRLFENYFILFKDSRVFLSGLLSLMGIFDMNLIFLVIIVLYWLFVISLIVFRIKKKGEKEKRNYFMRNIVFKGVVKINCYY